MAQPKPLAIRLYPAEIANLERVAAQVGSVAKTGKNAGKPSWRTLIKDVANGRLVVSGDTARR